MALPFGDHVHAVMHPVDEVDVRVAGRTEHHLRSRRESARRVRGQIMLAQVGFDLNDSADAANAVDNVNQVAAQKVPGDFDCRAVIKLTRQRLHAVSVSKGTQRVKKSAGLLPFRRRGSQAEVFLTHPGGPFWARKDDGAWSIPKGEFTDAEDPLAAAQREFMEETGFSVQGPFHELGPIRQPGGKVVHAWAVEFDGDPRAIRSNTFSIEWPPRSGRTREFPEVDRAEWFPLEIARVKILKGQRPLMDQLEAMLGRIEAG
jgi:predicted NUDIX family NTP pyrophosphohydrolase